MKVLQPGEEGSCIKNISVANKIYVVEWTEPTYSRYFHAKSRHGDHLWVAITQDSYITVGVAARDKSYDCEGVVVRMMQSLQPQSTA